MITNKSKLRKLLYAYAALMLILIFFSNTIYNISLPKVAVAMPTSGRLTKELEARGVIAFSETVEIYAATSGLIDEILVKKGDFLDRNALIATYKAEKSNADASAAELEFAVERNRNHIAALYLNKSIIEAKLDALSVNVSLDDDLYIYRNAIEDAQRALEQRSVELLDLQNVAGAFSGEREYQHAIEDAEWNWDRMKAELEEAEAALAAAELAMGTMDGVVAGAAQGAADGVAAGAAEGATPGAMDAEAAVEVEAAVDAEAALEEETETGVAEVDGASTFFDDYELQQSILDASIALERKKTELADAEDALADAMNDRLSAFDSYIYDNAIDKATILYDRSLEDYDGALRMYNIAVQQYDAIIYAGAGAGVGTGVSAGAGIGAGAAGSADADDTETYAYAAAAAADAAAAAYESEIKSAQKNIDDAQNHITASKRQLADASVALNDATIDLVRAESAFYANIDKIITDAEQRVILAECAVDDAQLAYDRAVDELDRARNQYYGNLYDTRQKAVDDAKKEVDAAQRSMDDAERLCDRAVSGRSEAVSAEARTGRKNLVDAENNLAEAQTALERAEDNYDMAQKALVAKTDETIKSLDFEMQKADLDIAGANLDLLAAEAALANAVSNDNDNDMEAGIISMYSGVVISIEKSKGQLVSRGEKVAVIGINNNMFEIGLSCPESEGRFIEIGDEASIRTNGAAAAAAAVVAGIKATVRDIVLIGETLNVSLSCETDAFKGGENVAIKFYKQTETPYETIVPNEAVIHETTGSYVWVIRSRQGALGTEYFSIRLKVLIADMDDYYTAISRGIDFYEPVAINYNKDLTLNGRVIRN